MPDADGYPTDEEIQRLKDWPFDDVVGIVKFIGSIWWCPDFGYSVKRGRLRLATGGWSGNEEIIGALECPGPPQMFHWFWIKHWECHWSGGLYIFCLSKDRFGNRLDGGGGK
jgi:hypothetical protein